MKKMEALKVGIVSLIMVMVLIVLGLFLVEEVDKILWDKIHSKYPNAMCVVDQWSPEYGNDNRMAIITDTGSIIIVKRIR